MVTICNEKLNDQDGENAGIGPNGVRLITDPQFERIREHAQAFRRLGANGRPLGWFGKIFDFLITAPIPIEEKWLFITLILIGDKKCPTREELAQIAKMRPDNVSKVLNRLKERNMVVWDELKVGHLNKKKLVHITDPYYWKGVFQSYNIPYNPKIKPHAWTPALLDFEEGRINEVHTFAEEDYGYVEAPRLLVDIDIPHKAKTLWLYIASLSTFEHPTCDEFADKLGIDKKTVRKYLDLLSEKKMILVHEHRNKGFGESNPLRIYHTIDVGLWKFDIAQSHYGKPVMSILYNTTITAVSSCGGNGTVMRGKRDCHAGETGLSCGGNGTVMRGKRDCHENSESQANSALQVAKIACETGINETEFSETGGWVKQNDPAPTHLVDVGSIDLNIGHADFEYTLIELVKKTVEPAFTYSYKSGKTHIPGPDSYRTIQQLAAAFIDTHGVQKLADFGSWLGVLRESRREKILLEKWTSLVERWLSGEAAEHPAIIAERALEAHKASDAYKEQLAAAKAQEEARKAAAEAEKAAALKEKAERERSVLALDFQAVVDCCIATRKMRPLHKKRLADASCVNDLMKFAREDAEFGDIFKSVVRQCLASASCSA